MHQPRKFSGLAMLSLAPLPASVLRQQKRRAYPAAAGLLVLNDLLLIVWTTG